MEIPKWLVPLLVAKFSSSPGPNPSQNNLGIFCLDCLGNPLSNIELNNHSGHDHIQVVQSSHEYAVRVGDMVNRINCHKIHPFRINQDSIFYLHPRDSMAFHNNPHVENCCKVCHHSLFKGSKYCSLACKFKKGISRMKDQVMKIGATGGTKKDKIDGRRRRKGTPRRAHQNPSKIQRDVMEDI